MVWLQKKSEMVSRLRIEKERDERDLCTFQPATNEYIKTETPNLGFLESNEFECRMVFDGKTYDLKKAKELQDFFKKAETRRVKRSVFTRFPENLHFPSRKLLN